jgi:hypothetical protein
MRSVAFLSPETELKRGKTGAVLLEINPLPLNMFFSTNQVSQQQNPQK